MRHFIITKKDVLLGADKRSDFKSKNYILGIIGSFFLKGLLEQTVKEPMKKIFKKKRLLNFKTIVSKKRSYV